MSQFSFPNFDVIIDRADESEFLIDDSNRFRDGIRKQREELVEPLGVLEAREVTAAKFSAVNQHYRQTVWGDTTTPGFRNAKHIPVKKIKGAPTLFAQ